MQRCDIFLQRLCKPNEEDHLRDPSLSRIKKKCENDERNSDKSMQQLNSIDIDQNIGFNSSLHNNTNLNLIDGAEDVELLTILIQEKLNIKIDVQPFEQVIKNILAQPTATPINSEARLNCLQQLSYGFSIALKSFEPKGPVELITEFDLFLHVKGYEKFMLELAKSLMYCKQFAELTLADKLILYKYIRPIIYHIERAYTSAVYFGTNMNDLRMLIDDTTAIDYLQNFRVKAFKIEDLMGALPIWEKIKEKYVKYIIKPMRFLQLSQYEIAYLLAHTLWNVQDIPGLSSDAISLADDLSQQIANDLHEYYTYGMRLPKYANRFQRCKQVGMQVERDKPMQQLNSIDIGQNIECNSSLPNNTNLYLIEGSEDVELLSILIQEKLNMKIDVQSLEQVIKNILAQPTATPINSEARLNCLQQLSYGFSIALKSFQPKGPVEVITEFDLFLHAKDYEKYMLELAKSLMYCKQFAELTLTDKLILFKYIRPIIYNIERAYTSAVYFGTNMDDLRMLLDDTTAIDFLNNFRLKAFKIEDITEAWPFWEKIKEKLVKYIMKPMKFLQLTQYEIAYLLAHTLWNVQDIPGLSSDAIRLADDLSQQIANDVHEYYTYGMRLPNYANSHSSIYPAPFGHSSIHPAGVIYPPVLCMYET
uniref:NR LBD domain-containing protein n=1 Tax=Acrobeloides nanus TaxID=290746 RepID=A0A914CIL4_9BILA